MEGEGGGKGRKGAREGEGGSGHALANLFR